MTDSLKQKLPIPVRTFAIADPMLWSATPLLFPDAYPARAAGRRTGVVPSVVTPLMAVPPGEDNRPVGGIPRLLALAALGGFDNQAVQRSYATHQVTAGAPPGPAELALAQLTATSLIGETARHDVDAEIGDPHWGLSMAGQLGSCWSTEPNSTPTMRSRTAPFTGGTPGRSDPPYMTNCIACRCCCP